ncbi:DUF1653 domain-containing protein [Cupriavidus sp. SW-Y-13]|nr:DUF1653 domain-containing protein [Cupriavidus sp. SW-Y-13]
MQNPTLTTLRDAFDLVSTFTQQTDPQYKVTSEAQALQLATHRHYKGGLYRRLFESKHSETGDVLTVYVHLWPHETGGWVRPAEMFHGKLADERVRFVPLEAESAANEVK